MYEFATGLIRVLEKRLPDTTDIDRMIGASSAKQAFSVLNDTDFADNTGGLTPEEYNAALEQDLIQLKETLQRSLESGDALFDFLFVDFDFLNIKIALKKQLLDSDDELMSQHGIVPIEDIERTIAEISEESKNPTSLPSNSLETLNHAHLDHPLHHMVISSIRNILRKLNKGKGTINSKRIDTISDQELFKTKRRIAKNLKNGFLKDLLKLQIDFLNTKTLLRLIKEKQHRIPKVKQKNFLNGGRISPQKLVHAYKQDEPILFENLKELLEWYRIHPVLEAFRNDQEPSRLEHKLTQAEHDFVKTHAKSEAAGAAVVVGYFLSKINGMRNVRLLMSGKLNDVPAKELQERVVL